MAQKYTCVFLFGSKVYMSLLSADVCPLSADVTFWLGNNAYVTLTRGQKIISIFYFLKSGSLNCAFWTRWTICSLVLYQKSANLFTFLKIKYRNYFLSKCQCHIHKHYYPDRRSRQHLTDTHQHFNGPMYTFDPKRKTHVYFWPKKENTCILLSPKKTHATGWPLGENTCIFMTLNPSEY